MKNRIKIILIVTAISVALITGLNFDANAAKAPSKNNTTVKSSVTKTLPKNVNGSKTSSQKPTPVVYERVNSLDVVANPSKYLNKHITIRAKFDKFSTLGLDYKPAFRSSEKYITFLIKRDDVINHVVPLSEMKNFLLRDVAEKHIDLKPGDLIEYSGVVFSNALGDVWINVDEFIVLSSKSEQKTPEKK